MYLFTIFSSPLLSEHSASQRWHPDVRVVAFVRLIVEAGFPDSLLLRENDDNENVLDMSIRLHKSFKRHGCFRSVIGYLLEEKQDVFL